MKKRTKFTLNEDEKLKALVNRYGIKAWHTIAEFMEGKNVRQCRERYYNYLQPHLVNGEWTPEDEQLLQAKIEEYGHKWAKITTFFRGRSEINVKNHWKMMERKMENRRLANPQNGQVPEDVGDAFDHPWDEEGEAEQQQQQQQGNQSQQNTQNQINTPQIQPINNNQQQLQQQEQPIPQNIHHQPQSIQQLMHQPQQNMNNVFPQPQIQLPPPPALPLPITTMLPQATLSFPPISSIQQQNQSRPAIVHLIPSQTNQK